MQVHPRYRLTVHRGGWIMAFLLLLAIDLLCWWQHHVWIAASLAFALAFLILMRDDR